MKVKTFHKMKKYIIMSFLTSVFTLLGCKNSNSKIYSGSPEFSAFERSSKVNLEKLNQIYEGNFERIFKMKISSTNDVFHKTVFVQNKIYNIGFFHQDDKLGKEGRIWYLMKIDPNTGEILEFKE